MASKFEITGVGELRRALRNAGDLADKALAAAMFEEQSAVITAAQELAPVDLNTLRASGTVLPPTRTGQRIEVEAGFGGAAAAYAIIQHEKHSSKSKFLERPFLQRAPKMAANLAKRVESAWQRLRV